MQVGNLPFLAGLHMICIGTTGMTSFKMLVNDSDNPVMEAEIGLQMNKDNEKPTVPPSSKGNSLRFMSKRLLQPQAVLFWFALVYCVSEFIEAMQEKENPFVVSPWIFVSNLMVGPLLMLITSVLILIHRLSTTAFAMAIAGYLIYVTAYRYMISIPNARGVPILSLDAMRIWFKVTPDNLILLAGFGSVALVFGTVQLLRLLRMRRKRLS
jgi:hypothetical protein